MAQDLLENGYVTGRPYMGITYLAVTDAQTAAQLGVNAYGIYVVDVVSGGPADKAGLKAGDRIVSIDNTEVAQKTDLGTLMQEHSAGDTLSITVARDGQMQTVSLTLGEKNASNSGNGTNGASLRRSLPSLHLSRTAGLNQDMIGGSPRKAAGRFFIIPGRKSLHCMAAVSLRRRRPGWGLSRAQTIRRRSAISTGRRAGGPAFLPPWDCKRRRAPAMPRRRRVRRAKSSPRGDVPARKIG